MYLPWFLLAELVSYLGYYLPWVAEFGFAAVVAVAAYLAFSEKFDQAAALLLAEIVIGSKGRLFAIDVGTFSLSIRMALWLVVLSGWAFHIAKLIRREKKIKPIISEYLLLEKLPYFWPLLSFVALAALNALWRGNAPVFIYQDANSWLYFLLIWPSYLVIKNFSAGKREFFQGVLVAAVAWLMIKTWLILYFFSHEFSILPDFYKWIRDSGVGEITAMQGSFYRIFIQSHVYPLLGLVFAWHFLSVRSAGRSAVKMLRDRRFLSAAAISGGLLSVILIGLSRSFWVGLSVAAAVIAGALLLDRQYRFRQRLNNALNFSLGMAASLLFALFLIFAIIKLPIPGNTAEFNAATVLSERATETNEAAIGSRWALLPVLGQAIAQDPLFGQGFGATVTYQSQDPRVVNETGGTYTTFAFEWGWLDLWLKLGLFGLVAYGYLLAQLWLQAGRTAYSAQIRLGLLALAVLHVFTPYLNHPLGIAILLIMAVITSTNNGLSKSAIYSILHSIKFKLFKKS